MSLAGTGLLEQPYLRGVCQASHLHQSFPDTAIQQKSWLLLGALGASWHLMLPVLHLPQVEH